MSSDQRINKTTSRKEIIMSKTLIILVAISLGSMATADKPNSKAKAMNEASKAVAKEQKEFDKCNRSGNCAEFR